MSALKTRMVVITAAPIQLAPILARAMKGTHWLEMVAHVQVIPVATPGELLATPRNNAVLMDLQIWMSVKQVQVYASKIAETL